MPTGLRNWACVPIPSGGSPLNAGGDDPAIVVTALFDKSILRIKLPDMTYRSVPFPQIAVGARNRADPIGPSTSPATPGIPPTVLTVLVVTSILRIVLFPVSATYKISPSDQTPEGRANLAAGPTPSAIPKPP